VKNGLIDPHPNYSDFESYLYRPIVFLTLDRKDMKATLCRGIKCLHKVHIYDVRRIFDSFFDLYDPDLRP